MTAKMAVIVHRVFIVNVILMRSFGKSLLKKMHSNYYRFCVDALCPIGDEEDKYVSK